ncbi:MAG: hypothetical protein IJV37_03635 [Bacteroidales bacterium]|nr:hypothetical protein [Bacteroidales bacterium]
MKRFFSLAAALLMAAVAMAQAPEDIISRMEEEMDRHEQDGVVMTVDMKIPIVGTTSTLTYILGDKVRAEFSVMNRKFIIWSDGQTSWEYNVADNELKISPADASSSSGDTEMFSGITDGYDVSIKKETPDAWVILCRKSRDNKDKDAPKTMDLVVAKGSFRPLSLSARMSGVTMTMRDISFGVTERQVTFDMSDCPGAKVVEK